MAEIKEIDRSEILVSEDEIVDLINSETDYEMVDNGIGHYEFWGTDYNDVRIEPELKTKPVTVIQDASEECILTEVTGHLDTDEEDGDHEAYWKAYMTSCKLERVKVKNQEDPDKHDFVCVYICEFEVEGE